MTAFENHRGRNLGIYVRLCTVILCLVFLGGCQGNKPKPVPDPVPKPVPQPDPGISFSLQAKDVLDLKSDSSHFIRCDGPGNLFLQCVDTSPPSKSRGVWVLPGTTSQFVGMNSCQATLRGFEGAESVSGVVWSQEDANALPVGFPKKHPWKVDADFANNHKTNYIYRNHSQHPSPTILVQNDGPESVDVVWGTDESSRVLYRRVPAKGNVPIANARLIKVQRASGMTFGTWETIEPPSGPKIPNQFLCPRPDNAGSLDPNFEGRWGGPRLGSNFEVALDGSVETLGLASELVASLNEKDQLVLFAPPNQIILDRDSGQKGALEGVWKDSSSEPHSIYLPDGTYLQKIGNQDVWLKGRYQTSSPNPVGRFDLDTWLEGGYWWTEGDRFYSYSWNHDSCKEQTLKFKMNAAHDRITFIYPGGSEQYLHRIP